MGPYAELWQTQRAERGITGKILWSDTVEGTERAEKPYPLFHARLLEGFESPIATMIYRDRVAIIVWEVPLATQICGEKIARSFRSYFNGLWEIARPLRR